MEADDAAYHWVPIALWISAESARKFSYRDWLLDSSKHGPHFAIAKLAIDSPPSDNAVFLRSTGVTSKESQP